jgi:3-phosphoshikimate 1-carboxyvinyltransferase
MNLIVKKTSNFLGSATIPASKSESIRGLFFALLAKGESNLMNLLDSEDTQDAIHVCKALGAEINLLGDTCRVNSFGTPIENAAQSFYTGNSGITTRFLMPILGLRENSHLPVTLDCGEQMRARPVQSLVDALRGLGLEIQYLVEEGVLPISVSGSLKGGKAEIQGITSQYLSALLIALPCAPLDSQIIVKNLHERPYVDMTLHWLQQQKIIYNHERLENKDSYFIKGNQKYKKFETSIPGDFSSASYIIAAAALISGSVELNGLDMKSSLQGDKKIVTLLQAMGANIAIEPFRLTIHGGKPLTGIPIDANDIPDLLPILAVIGAVAGGKTEIYNVRQARIKETDRIHSMTEGLRRLGGKVEEQEDGMIIHHSKLHGALLEGYGDHRTVMALSVAGMCAEGVTRIRDPDAIKKTFPQFVEIMQSLGAKSMQVKDDVYG